MNNAQIVGRTQKGKRGEVLRDGERPTTLQQLRVEASTTSTPSTEEGRLVPISRHQQVAHSRDWGPQERGWFEHLARALGH